MGKGNFGLKKEFHILIEPDEFGVCKKQCV